LGALESDRLERHDRHRVGDLTPDHRHGFLEGHPPRFDAFRPLRVRFARHQPGCQKENSHLVGDRVGQIEFAQLTPGSAAVARFLRQLAPELALVHAQSESLTSFDQTQQRVLLDRFGGLSTEAVAEAYAHWLAARQKLDELLQGEQDRLRMVDLWSYQQKEIDAAHLEAGEDETLETEKRVLANAEKLYAAAMGAFEELYEGGSSAEAALRAAIKNVEELARYDARFTEAAQQLASARATVGDVGSSLRDYAEGINASPDRLAEIEDRLALLDRLKRKYGKTVAEIIAFGEDVGRHLAEVDPCRRTDVQSKRRQFSI